MFSSDFASSKHLVHFHFCHGYDPSAYAAAHIYVSTLDSQMRRQTLHEKTAVGRPEVVFYMWSCSRRAFCRHKEGRGAEMLWLIGLSVHFFCDSKGPLALKRW